MSAIDNLHEAAGFLSSTSAITALPEFARVVAEVTVAGLLNDLRAAPSIAVLLALSKKVATDPVDPEHFGNVQAMADDWLAWADANPGAIAAS